MELAFEQIVGWGVWTGVDTNRLLWLLSACSAKKKSDRHNRFMAFLGLFTSVSFHMPSQTTLPKICNVAVVTFVWFFANMAFQMCLQSVCFIRSEVTLIAFVRLIHRWFFSEIAIILPRGVLPNRNIRIGKWKPFWTSVLVDCKSRSRLVDLSTEVTNKF